MSLLAQKADKKHEREWWDAIGFCICKIANSREPVNLYLSFRGYPSTVPGIDYVKVGTYTPAVTVEQLAEDFQEAERQRRRHYV